MMWKKIWSRRGSWMTTLGGVGFTALMGLSPIQGMAEEEGSAAGIPVGGRVLTDFYIPSGSESNAGFQQISGSLWLQADPQFGQNTSVHFTLTGDEIVTSSVLSSQFRGRLREGYVDYAPSGWDLRAGKMIIPWGKSDVVNPTGFLTGTDWTFFNPDEEVRRTSAVGISISWTPEEGNSPWTFTLIALPVFAQSKLLLAPGQIPANTILGQEPQTPSTTLGNSESAFKLSYAGNQWDTSLLVFRGWNHLPEFQLVSLTPSAAVVNETFHRYIAVGGDGSFTTGKWIFRGEVAYVWTENTDGQNPGIQPSHLDAVLGMERPIGHALGGDFRIQGQFLLRYFPYFMASSQAGGSSSVLDSVSQQIAAANALVQNYQDQGRPGGTLRLSFSNEVSGVNSDLFLMGNFLGGGYLIRPQLGYSWADSLKTILGIDYYGGPRDRPLGVYSPYNAIFAEAKYVF